jgi:hypothetical protein
MENTNFKAPHDSTDSSAFRAPSKLAEHLEGFATRAEGARHKMEEGLRDMLAFTDMAVLRAAEVTQDN